MAAGLRFLDCTEERVAVVCVKEGAIEWTKCSKSFGLRPKRGIRVSEWTAVHAFFAKDELATMPETVSASAWLEDESDDRELIEHVFPLKKYGRALSLLWWRP